MRSGWPQPTIRREVGVGSAFRASGVTEAQRVRRYSWQICLARRVVSQSSSEGTGGPRLSGDKRREDVPRKRSGG